MVNEFIIFVNDMLRSEEFRKKVVLTALDHRGRVSQSASNKLKRAINERVVAPVRGYDKNRSAAPTGLLVEYVVAASEQVPQVFEAVLNVWREAQQPLEQAIREHFQAQGLLPADNTSAERAIDKWTMDDVADAVDHCCGIHAQASRDDVHLMMLCVLGHLPQFDEAQADEASPHEQTLAGATDAQALDVVTAMDSVAALPPAADAQAMLTAQAEATVVDDAWLGWLGHLEALPSDAPAWTSFPEFLVAAQRIADQKQQARETSREVLRQALCDVRPRIEAHAEYFGFDDYEHWNAEDVVLSAASALATDVQALDQAILAHNTISDRPVRTSQERREREAAATALEQEIERRYHELSEVFTRHDGRAPSGPSPGPVQPAPADSVMETSLPDASELDTLPLAPPQVEVGRHEATLSHPSNVQTVINRLEVVGDGQPEPLILDAALSNPEPVAGEVSASPDQAADAAEQVLPDEQATAIVVEQEATSDGVLDEDLPLDDEFEPTVVVEPSGQGVTMEPAEALAPAVAKQLRAWLGEWQELPRAYLLASWLEANEAATAAAFPPRSLYNIAYYAFQPQGSGGGAHCPPLGALEDALLHSQAAEFTAMAWHVGAGLVLLRGEISVVDALFAYALTLDEQFAPWHGFATTLMRYAGQTHESLSRAAGRSVEMQQRPDPIVLAVPARQALEQLTKPGRFPFRAGRDLIARIDRELASLGRALTSQGHQTSGNAMTVADAAKWARELKPSAILQRWARACDWPDNLTNRANLRELEVDLRTLQRYVAVWAAAASPVLEDTTLRAFSELREAVVANSQSWRADWCQYEATWPGVVAWSDLLLQRIAETVGATIAVKGTHV